MKVSIDFETFSVGKLDKIGAWAYAAHRSTESVCMSWHYHGDGQFAYLWKPEDGMPQDLMDLFYNIEQRKCSVYAWNATFEYFFWNLCCTRKYGWPRLPAEQVFDTMAIAQSRGLPGKLDTCGEALNLDVQKDKAGKNLIHKLSKPRKPSKRNPATRWTPETAPDDFAAFYEYCRQDVLAETAIYKRLKRYELSHKERALWLMTLRMNEQGVPVDRVTSDGMADLMVDYEGELNSELEEITFGEVSTSGQVQKIRDFLEFYDGIETPDLSKDTVEDLLTDQTISQKSRRILEIRQALSKSSTKKYIRILEMVDENDRVHDVLRYHQASTGRWGGTGIQPHNLPRAKPADLDTALWAVELQDPDTVEMFFDNPFKLGEMLLRPMIKAESGHKLIVSDFSSIENRVLCWLAGDKLAIELFRRGYCQYRWFATRLYPGVSYYDVTDAQRNHAKRCILGLGYGMGAPKFAATSASYGVEITQREAERDVKLYRKIYKQIVKMWYDMYDIAMTVVKTGHSQRWGRLAYYMEDDFLHMLLPSGRSISYYQPKIQMRDTPWGERKQAITYKGMKSIEGTTGVKWCRIDQIPGKLTENATQAVARDLLCDAKIRLQKAGYNMLFSVHDEVVIHEPVDGRSIKDVNKIMSQTDEIVYPVLPIAAEGYESTRYKKG